MSFQPKSDFLDIMMSRGFLADCTDYEGLDKALLAGGMPGYIGCLMQLPNRCMWAVSFKL